MEKRKKAKRRRHSDADVEFTEEVEHNVTEKKKHKGKQKHQDRADESEVSQIPLEEGKQTKEEHHNEEHSSSPNQSDAKRKKKKKKHKKDKDSDSRVDSRKEEAIEPLTEIEESNCSEADGRQKKRKKSKAAPVVEEQEIVMKKMKGCSQEAELDEPTPDSDSKIDPEKAEMKRKKRERMKQKRDAKQQHKLNAQSGNTADIASPAALEYLRKWESDRSNWKFQTVRQVWLLKHMYSDDDVSDEDFSILLKYLEGLKGLGRKVTSEKAEELLNSHEKALADDSNYQSEGDDNSQQKDGVSKEDKGKILTASQVSRVRQVLQLIS